MNAWQNDWFSTIKSGSMAPAWRGVEDQHKVSTLVLTDTTAECDVLEEMLETSKPKLPPTAVGKHYLIASPFRYSPEHESRFRPARALGQWYGAGELSAACAEVAYWRHRFIMDSAGLIHGRVVTSHTFFNASVSGQSIDLMTPPWSDARSAWTSNDYGSTQALAAQAQAHGVQWIAYESVRAPSIKCAVVFDAACLAEPEGGLDKTSEAWLCMATRTEVSLTRKSDHERFDWTF